MKKYWFRVEMTSGETKMVHIDRPWLTTADFFLTFPQMLGCEPIEIYNAFFTGVTEEI